MINRAILFVFQLSSQFWWFIKLQTWFMCSLEIAPWTASTDLRDELCVIAHLATLSESESSLWSWRNERRRKIVDAFCIVHWTSRSMTILCYIVDRYLIINERSIREMWFIRRSLAFPVIGWKLCARLSFPNQQNILKRNRRNKNISNLTIFSGCNTYRFPWFANNKSSLTRNFMFLSLLIFFLSDLSLPSSQLRWLCYLSDCLLIEILHVYIKRLHFISPNQQTNLKPFYGGVRMLSVEKGFVREFN